MNQFIKDELPICSCLLVDFGICRAVLGGASLTCSKDLHPVPVQSCCQKKINFLHIFMKRRMCA
jgi:hypothetical protein